MCSIVYLYCTIYIFSSNDLFFSCVQIWQVQFLVLIDCVCVGFRSFHFTAFHHSQETLKLKSSLLANSVFFSELSSFKHFKICVSTCKTITFTQIYHIVSYQPIPPQNSIISPNRGCSKQYLQKGRG